MLSTPRAMGVPSPLAHAIPVPGHVPGPFHSGRDRLLRRQTMTPRDMKALLAFLKTLTLDYQRQLVRQSAQMKRVACAVRTIWPEKEILRQASRSMRGRRGMGAV
jgi:hypothetical protein